MVLAGILVGLSLVLMLLEIPIPFLPPWLKLDFSTVPLLIGGFAMGPVWGICMQAVKSALHLLWSSTGGVGELADFIMGGAFVLTASLIYHYHPSFKGALAGCGFGVIALCAAGALANYFLLMPMYIKVMGMDAIINAAQARSQIYRNIDTIVFYGVLPFNLIKGVAVSLLCLPVYRRLENYLKKD